MSTSTLFRFSKKLKALKPILRELSRTNLSDISRRAADAYKDLCALQQTTITNPSPQAVRDETQAFDRWEKVAALEENFLKQRSKLHWLQVGDRNNSFFHNAVKERKAINSIHEVYTHAGIRLTAPEDIKAEAVRVFFRFTQCGTS